MTEKKLKAIRVDRGAGQAAMPDEAAEIAKVDAELVSADCATEDEIIAAAMNADAIITVGAQITRRVSASLPRCKVIVRYGIGYDTIDVPGATDAGILVVNIPDFCLEEVSSHAIALMLALARKLLPLNNLVKQGKWVEAMRSMAPMGPIHGQTLGIIGCGNIGRLSAVKAKPFGLRILGYDPYLDKEVARSAGITLVPLPELLREADYVTLHPLLNDETRHIIGEKELHQMKRSAFLINTARGPVVDEAALVRALQDRRIAGAGLDVFEQEPIAADSPLLKMDNVILTPHSAFFSDAAYARLRRSVGQEAARVLGGRWPKHVVNVDVKPKVPLARD